MVLRLEVFESDLKKENPATLVLDVSHLEEAKLAAYDSGYAAGWEDAVAAEQGDQSRIQADLARNLQALGFTYHEARTAILSALQPLLVEVVDRLLPAIARETLGPIVLETLMPLAEELADIPVTLVLNPTARPSVETLLQAKTGLELILEEEASLGEGQVYLRIGGQERLVDTDRAIAWISAAVHAFFDPNPKDITHG